MDVKKRLLRRPVTTILWTLTVVIMALMLCVGSALLYSSASLAGILDKYHTSIAVNTDRAEQAKESEWGILWTYADRNLYQEDIDFLMSLEAVEDIYFQTLTAATSPSFSPLAARERYSYDNETYYNVMVAGTVTNIFQVEDLGYAHDLSSIGLGSEETNYACFLEIQVDQLILCNGSFLNKDKVTHLNINIPLTGKAAAEYFEEGAQYLFFGECDPSRIVYLPNMQSLSWLKFPLRNACIDGQLYALNFDFSYHGLGESFIPVRPAVARLDGTVEEFLNDPDHSEWVEMAKSWDLLQHSMPVIGSESVESMYAFVAHDATLEEGRFFTREEYDTGAKVCLISTSLAERSGIKVGDTVSISQFYCHNQDWEYDRNHSILINEMMNNPTAGAFVPKLELETENEAFTVVGLYRLSNEWEETSYAFTPNTLFIPQKAQISGGFGGMSQVRSAKATDEANNPIEVSVLDEGGTTGIYFTIRLNNSMVSDFKAAMEGTKYMGWFLTVDQGFENILGGLNTLTGSSLRLFTVVALGWLVLLVLYLLLYQNTQRRTLGIMRSQGSGIAAARNYLFVSGLVPVLFGITLGSVLSLWVIDYAQESLIASAFGQAVFEGSTTLNQEVLDSMILQSQLPGWMLAMIAIIQIALFALLLWLQAAKTAKLPPRKLLVR